MGARRQGKQAPTEAVVASGSEAAKPFIAEGPLQGPAGTGGTSGQSRSLNSPCSSTTRSVMQRLPQRRGHLAKAPIADNRSATTATRDQRCSASVGEQFAAVRRRSARRTASPTGQEVGRPADPDRPLPASTAVGCTDIRACAEVRSSWVHGSATVPGVSPDHGRVTTLDTWSRWSRSTSGLETSKAITHHQQLPSALFTGETVGLRRSGARSATARSPSGR